MAIKVRVGQQNGIQVTSSISGSAGGVAVVSENVIGGIGSLSELTVNGYSSFAGVSTFNDNVFINGDLTLAGTIIGNLSDVTVDGNAVFVGIATFNNDVFIDGNLTVGGNFSFDQFTAEEITTKRLTVIGVTTTNALSIGATQVISDTRQLQNITSLDAVTTATIESAIQNAPNTFVDIEVTGISTFTGDLYYGQSNSYGVAYFLPSGLMETTLGPEDGIDYTNNIFTTDNSGIPCWSNAIDGGAY